MSVGTPCETNMNDTVKAKMPRPPPGPPAASKKPRGRQPASTMSAWNRVADASLGSPKPGKKPSKMSGSVAVSLRLMIVTFLSGLVPSHVDRAASIARTFTSTESSAGPVADAEKLGALGAAPGESGACRSQAEAIATRARAHAGREMCFMRVPQCRRQCEGSSDSASEIRPGRARVNPRSLPHAEAREHPIQHVVRGHGTDQVVERTDRGVQMCRCRRRVHGLSARRVEGVDLRERPLERGAV